MGLFEYVATRIRELRTSYAGQGLSQEALGRELGVATNTISRWETGIYRPTLEDLDKLARIFGVSILEFFPPAEQPANDQLYALLRAAEQLRAEDIDELRRYAEFKRAQAMYKNGIRPAQGRKRKERE
jgi:transcriptional regulator with XRE-family HTH domain